MDANPPLLVAPLKSTSIVAPLLANFALFIVGVGAGDAELMTLTVVDAVVTNCAALVPLGVNRTVNVPFSPTPPERTNEPTRLVDVEVKVVDAGNTANVLEETAAPLVVLNSVGVIVTDDPGAEESV